MKKIYQRGNDIVCPFSKQLLSTIADKSFVCIGAQNSTRTGNVGFLSLDFMNQENAEVLAENMDSWVKDADYENSFLENNFKFISFVVLFKNEEFANENDAEYSLWRFLKNVHLADVKRNFWDGKFAKNVYSKDFAFSVGGYGHFVPMLHPKASSLVRYSLIPTLVFNPHCMFSQMKKLSFFEKMKGEIREREQKQQLWINPKLSNSGENLEAPQYALTKNQVFNIGSCPFTGFVPDEFPTYKLL